MMKYKIFLLSMSLAALSIGIESDYLADGNRTTGTYNPKTSVFNPTGMPLKAYTQPKYNNKADVFLWKIF